MGIHGKGNAIERIYQKINKKIKKVVDIAKKIWYINEATCKKKASEVISENWAKRQVIWEARKY